MDEELKVTVRDSIRNVLSMVETMPYKEGATLMYQFLSGMLVGGTIDLNKGVKPAHAYAVDDSAKDLINEQYEKWLKKQMPEKKK